ncbi:hypothetical protein DUNSADRAFT_2240 [Dunaliella salina]|uniref:Encoded protein n=1 Tax=Dunaliella salina TaxID=3046 RepID=A0ABQ7GVY2_DUNSA|nr:hypothetical protein DUNSADRAFT_2240 [Dunaliella salina]|eukprot:KAF5838777.1 hypothetical protein DUNSADRAFT_2240 [Dunaliella salina]
MKQHIVELCAALQEAEERVPKLLAGLKSGWKESDAVDENGGAEGVFSPPNFSPDWSLGLEDEETIMFSNGEPPPLSDGLGQAQKLSSPVVALVLPSSARP